MLLGKRIKTAMDHKRYIIDYDDFLDLTETISTMSYSVSPSGMTVDTTSLSSDSRSAYFFVTGGTLGVTYTVTATMTSTTAQVKVDTMEFVVVEP